MSDDGSARATSATAQPATSTTASKVGALGPTANRADQRAGEELQTAAALRAQAQNLTQNHEGFEVQANGMHAEATRAEHEGHMLQGIAAGIRDWMAGLGARRKAS